MQWSLVQGHLSSSGERLLRAGHDNERETERDREKVQMREMYEVKPSLYKSTLIKHTWVSVCQKQMLNKYLINVFVNYEVVVHDT